MQVAEYPAECGSLDIDCFACDRETFHSQVVHGACGLRRAETGNPLEKIFELQNIIGLQSMDESERNLRIFYF